MTSHAARKVFRLESDSKRVSHRRPLGIQVAVNVRFTPVVGRRAAESFSCSCGAVVSLILHHAGTGSKKRWANREVNKSHFEQIRVEATRVSSCHRVR